MSTTTWSAILTATRTTIAAISPAVAGRATSTFAVADGFLSLVDEPLVSFDRIVVVEGGSSKTNDWAGGGFRDISKEMTVTVGYDSAGDAKTLEERLSRDEEQIVNALIAPGGFPSGVTYVEHLGSEIDRMPVPEEPAKVICEHRFRVDYHLSL